MAAPEVQPVLTEIIDTLKAQKQATERHIDLIKQRNKILENIVPVDKDLLIKEKETLTGIAGAMKGIKDNVDAAGNAIVTSAEGFVTEIFGPTLGGIINTLTIGFFTRWRAKGKEDKRQAELLKEQNKKADELYDKRLDVMAESAIRSREQLDKDIATAADPAADEATKEKGKLAKETLEKEVEFQDEDQKAQTKKIMQEQVEIKAMKDGHLEVVGTRNKTRKEALEELGEAGITREKLGDLNHDQLKDRTDFVLKENEASEDHQTAQQQVTDTYNLLAEGIESKAPDDLGGGGVAQMMMAQMIQN